MEQSNERSSPRSGTAAGYTAGPWAVSEFDLEADGVSADAGRICNLYDRQMEQPIPDPDDQEQTNANARLIAAAPEMYEALRALVEASAPMTPQQDLIWPRLVAALKKARGEAV